MLERNVLGTTGIEVTRLGLGGAGYGGVFGELAEREAVATVERALEVGINYLDTSPLYAQSEKRLGMALKGRERSSYVLSTKVGTHPERRGDYSAEGARWSLENSQRLLGTDWFDIVLIHDPSPEGMDQALGPGGALEELLRWKDAGRIKVIGTGLHDHDLHRRAMAIGEIEVILTFADYNLIRQTNEELVREAQRRGVAVINAAVLEFGLLGGEDPRDICARTGWRRPEEQIERVSALLAWTQERRLDLGKLAIAFSLRCKAFLTTLVGCSTPGEVDVAVRALEHPEPESTWQAFKDRFGIEEMGATR